MPLGDSAALMRFSPMLDGEANKRAIEFAKFLVTQNHPAITQITPSLVSVLISYDFAKISYNNLIGELRLVYSLMPKIIGEVETKIHKIDIVFDGEDLAEVTHNLSLSIEEFIELHNEKSLRVLTTGFAPGFIYTGMHPNELHLPRREVIKPSVPAGSVLFAAGQTAITATAIPTGWHVIGNTKFLNFNTKNNPPTILNSGDLISFKSVKK